MRKKMVGFGTRPYTPGFRRNDEILKLIHLLFELAYYVSTRGWGFLREWNFVTEVNKFLALLVIKYIKYLRNFAIMHINGVNNSSKKSSCKRVKKIMSKKQQSSKRLKSICEGAKDHSMQHLDAKSCELVAEFFSILGHARRVAIFCELHNGRKTVSELAGLCGATLPNVSQHLRIMRDKGMVKTEKEGQSVYYSIVDERFVDACRTIRDALIEHMHVRAGVLDNMQLLD
jgi:ArsR family transcriptional regulator, virulence genes transcriptional regulator